jgi:hypothetical protein
MSTHLSIDEQNLSQTTGLDLLALQLLKETWHTPLHHWKFQAIRSVADSLPPLSVTIRYGEPYLQPDYTHSFMVRTLETDGIYLLVDESNAIEELLKLRPQLAQLNTQIMILGNYLTGRRLKNVGIALHGQLKNKVVIGALKSNNWRDFLWLLGTNGINFGFDTKNIIAKFEAWAQLCEFDVVGAGFDWCELYFRSLPDNLHAFAEELYQLCPEHYDEKRNVRQEIKGLSQSIYTWFWWD